MNLKSLLVLLGISTMALCSTGVRAKSIGGDSGGGGDECENRIQQIRDDIHNWIISGGHNGLQYSTTTKDIYQPSMLYFLSAHSSLNENIQQTTDIECIHRPIEVQAHEKICRFDQLESGPKITCYFEAFLDKNTMDEDAQYRLIHHEYAGLAGIETPVGSQSIYTYSNQISNFLENQTIRKLSIKLADPLDDTFVRFDFKGVKGKVSKSLLENKFIRERKFQFTEVYNFAEKFLKENCGYEDHTSECKKMDNYVRMSPDDTSVQDCHGDYYCLLRLGNKVWGNPSNDSFELGIKTLVWADEIALGACQEYLPDAPEQIDQHCQIVGRFLLGLEKKNGQPLKVKLMQSEIWSVTFQGHYYRGQTKYRFSHADLR